MPFPCILPVNEQVFTSCCGKWVKNYVKSKCNENSTFSHVFGAYWLPPNRKLSHRCDIEKYVTLHYDGSIRLCKKWIFKFLKTNTNCCLCKLDLCLKYEVVFWKCQMLETHFFNKSFLSQIVFIVMLVKYIFIKITVETC